MKLNSPFFKRTLCAVLALTLALGCGFGTAVAGVLPAVTATQSAALVDWNARTYDVTISASSSVTTPADPVNIVLVLDKSGSMPWMISKPTGNSGNRVNTLDHSKTDNSAAQYNYFYYVNKDDEYEPLGYIDHSSDRSIYANPSAYNQAGWYIITSNSNGKKQIKDFIVSGSANRPTIQGANIYLRGSGDQTKFEKLVEVTGGFIDQLKGFSESNKVSVVGFSEGTQNLNFLSLNAANTTTLKNFISNMTITGGTDFNSGMQQAENYINSLSDARKKYVIVLSDGVSTSSGETTVAGRIKAHQYNGVPDTKIFTVGIYGGSVTGTALTNAQNLMQSLSSGTGYFFTSTALNDMQTYFNNIFNSISQSVTASVQYKIDPRFELFQDNGVTVAQSGDTAYGGGTVTVTTDPGTGIKTWSIQWPNTTIPPQSGAVAGWNRTLHLRAKTEFIGGNAVPVTAPDSGVTVETTNTPFSGSTPTVNVKPVFYLGNAASTIFLGEKVPATAPLQPFTTDQAGGTGNKFYEASGSVNMFINQGTTGSFTYQWSGNGISSTQIFPGNVSPRATTTYKLTATFASSAPWVAMKNTNGMPFAEPVGGNRAANADNGSDNYTVTVLSGKITITKTVTGAAADSGRNFVFLVTEQNNNIAPFYVTIRMNTDGSLPSKTVTGLPKGSYTIKEVNSNWQYSLVSKSGDSGTLGTLSGYTDTSISAAFTNHFSDRWFNATDSVTNIIHS